MSGQLAKMSGQLASMSGGLPYVERTFCPVKQTHQVTICLVKIYGEQTICSAKHEDRDNSA